MNCLCFNSAGTVMYSCDSVGSVITWRVTLSPSPEIEDEWVPERIFSDPEISVSVLCFCHDCILLEKPSTYLDNYCSANTFFAWLPVLVLQVVYSLFFSFLVPFCVVISCSLSHLNSLHSFNYIRIHLANLEFEIAETL